ncbi:MAG TPA: hypothetical protein VGN14_02385 [Candidatus Elarobacter sp.]
MEQYNADRRRSVLDIVADLGFLERKQQATADDTPAAESSSAPALTLVPSIKHDSAPPAAPAASREHVDVVEALTEAQRRAAEQRVAAERFLQETVQLEQRLAEEAEQARAAGDHVLAEQLAKLLAETTVVERQAVEQAETCAKKIERIEAQKAQADALRTDDKAVEAAAAADVIAAQARLAEARRRLEIATVACTESNQRFTDICVVEDAARAEAEKTAQAAAAHRAEREKIEAELREVQERAAAFKGSVPSLASVEQLRALEARSAAPSEATKRLAERRAADAARRTEVERAAAS